MLDAGILDPPTATVNDHATAGPDNGASGEQEPPVIFRGDQAVIRAALDLPDYCQKRHAEYRSRMQHGGFSYFALVSLNRPKWNLYMHQSRISGITLSSSLT